MQSVSAAFTAEEKDSVRKIIQNTQISWHKQSLLGNRTFTIGVSTIGGNDIIGINPGAVGSPGNYKYFDESTYVTSLGWERGYNMPTGGLTKGLAEMTLDNTSGRFTPRYMGGSSELYTAIQPSKPFIINAGFNFAGIDQSIPQFAGIITEQPQVDMRSREVSIRGADYIDFFQNKYLDHEVMFTGQRTDEVLTTLLGTLGMNTAEYDLDMGINIIPFGLFEKGSRFSDLVSQLVEAENGHFYQDEIGIFKFENRQHWDSSPYNAVQKLVLTGQVINAEAPTEDHLINVVEVKSQVLAKQSLQLIFQLSSAVKLLAGQDTPVFVNFDDPVLALNSPTFQANLKEDGSGSDRTTSVYVKDTDIFATSAKYIFHNNSIQDVFLTTMTLYGRVAKKSKEIYYRAQDDSSVTAYQERPLTIENDYIQNESWAQSYAQMILNDFSNIENIQRITLRAIPELQLGDLISWQGRYWRIFDIKTTLDPSMGFVQELTLLQRNITTYFRIGVSTIGGTDRIAP